MSGHQPPVCAPPDLEVRAPRSPLPVGATDCHAHVFGRPERYPYAAARAYTPPAVFLDDYLAMHEAIGITRGVLVQSGVHGTDNSVILDAIREHPERLRGVALLAQEITDAALATLHDGGVRGFRSNLVAKTGVQLGAARALAARVKALGWHVQFLLDVEEFPDLDEVFGDFPTEVVIDHMGRPDPRVGVQGRGFQALLRLLRSGRAWAKLSAPYR
ncbi:MAG TPA: amidohydrolase family protein, partial [Acetobacteraceae bacterium]